MVVNRDSSQKTIYFEGYNHHTISSALKIMTFAESLLCWTDQQAYCIISNRTDLNHFTWFRLGFPCFTSFYTIQQIENYIKLHYYAKGYVSSSLGRRSIALNYYNFIIILSAYEQMITC